jgi:dTDP-glucose 4,6-dehydratase/UDP-glucose 4-epimerase
MNVLIFGASGFIGNAVMDHFSVNHSVTGIDRIGNAEKNILTADDFKRTAELISENKFDLIINCAGSSNVSQSVRDPQHDFELNTILVQHLLCAIKESSPGTKFINISSAAVYGNPATLPIKESDLPKPLSPYGLHKLLSEELISHYSRLYQIQALSVRIFSAYGTGLKRQFFYDLYTKFMNNAGGIELAGTGNESRDFIFISDIAEALEVLFQKAAFNGEAYNLGSGEESFIAPTASLFARICGYKGEIRFNQKQFEGYPLNWKACTGKLSALGFSPKVTLEEGLKNYLDYLKSSEA